MSGSRRAGHLGSVVAAGAVVSLIGYGIRGDFGLFLDPMLQSRGWSRETFAFALAVQNLMWGVGQPIAGAIADRFGAGRVLAAGALLYATGIALGAVVDGPILLHMTFGVMTGLGLSGASLFIVLGAFGKQLPPARRAWAAGIGTAAGSLGQFLFAPLGQGFIAAWGWQVALIVLAASALPIIGMAVALRGGETPGVSTETQTLRSALREAAATRSYWLLVAGFFVCGFHLAFIQVHLPAYLAGYGLGPSLGAWSIGVVGLFNTIGAYAAGIMSGRRSRKRLLTGIYLGRALAIALFVATPPTATSVLMFAAVMGLLWLSTVPPTSGLVALMFGPRYMSMLFGIVFFSHQVGAFLGVWLGGWAYDVFGSYALVWWLSVALGLISAALHWPIAERPVAHRYAQAKSHTA
jgi:MFS family permease